MGHFISPSQLARGYHTVHPTERELQKSDFVTTEKKKTGNMVNQVANCRIPLTFHWCLPLTILAPPMLH